jgi:hypothetical protein
MALQAALTARKTNPQTPLKARGWATLLYKYNLTHKYLDITDSLSMGFTAGLPPLHHTFTPPNNPSICIYQSEFDTIIAHEYSTGQHIGLFTRAQLEATIGFFQSSPLSIIPKPGKPGKFQLIQDFSHPHNISAISPSINSLTVMRTS